MIEICFNFATEAVQRKQATVIFPQVSLILCSSHVRLKTTCTVFMYFLEVCCAYQQSIQSLWNFSLGVKTMQLSSDRRPVLGVPSYSYGSTHHFHLLNLGRYKDSLKWYHCCRRLGWTTRPSSRKLLQLTCSGMIIAEDLNKSFLTIVPPVGALLCAGGNLCIERCIIISRM